MKVRTINLPLPKWILVEIMLKINRMITGILQKGDGANIYLKHKPRLIITAMGDGRQRELECGADCSGKTPKHNVTKKLKSIVLTRFL